MLLLVFISLGNSLVALLEALSSICSKTDSKIFSLAENFQYLEEIQYLFQIKSSTPVECHIPRHEGAL